MERNTIIETNRLYLQEARDGDIGKIIEFETHRDNRDQIWTGTVEEHRQEIRDPDHMLLVFSKKTDRNIIGYALNRLDVKAEICELKYDWNCTF